MAGQILLLLMFGKEIPINPSGLPPLLKTQISIQIGSDLWEYPKLLWGQVLNLNLHCDLLIHYKKILILFFTLNYQPNQIQIPITDWSN